MELGSQSVSQSIWLIWVFGLSVGWLIVSKQIRLDWEAATVNISDKLKINSAHTHTHTSRPTLDHDDVLCQNTAYLYKDESINKKEGYLRDARYCSMDCRHDVEITPWMDFYEKSSGGCSDNLYRRLTWGFYIVFGGYRSFMGYDAVLTVLPTSVTNCPVTRDCSLHADKSEGNLVTCVTTVSYGQLLQAHPSNRAIYGVSLRPLDCWVRNTHGV
jgi:hypothetical protein